jgi:hypothetical protein
MRNFARYWLVAHGVRELVGMLLRHESSCAITITRDTSVQAVFSK